MVLSSIWNRWSNSSSSATGTNATKPQAGHRNKNKGERAVAVENGYYPGLVNISGTYCFMNSTLQALASLAYLRPYLCAIQSRAEELDVPTAVTDTLLDLLNRLNTPLSHSTSYKPLELIEVLSSQPSLEGRSMSLFRSREHQDAQELFQLLSESIKSEAAEVEKESRKDRGFAGIASALPSTSASVSVFDGLTANRRSCVICGYTEAIMHFSFDNWQLAVPTMASNCFLEDCLEEYTRLETLRDCICRKCSLAATHRRVLQEITSASNNTTASSNTGNPNGTPAPSKSHTSNAMSSSKRRKKREKEKAKELQNQMQYEDLKEVENILREAIEQRRIEDDLYYQPRNADPTVQQQVKVEIDKVFSAMSTKQAMIARAPPVLPLHLNRSVHSGYYGAQKNNIRVVFPELLDLTPYTTDGKLSLSPMQSISSAATESIPNGHSDPQAEKKEEAAFSKITQRTLYRLSSVVCHFGSHSFGHYISYRRKPPSALAGQRGWEPPTLIITPTQDPVKIEDDVDEMILSSALAPNTGNETFSWRWKDADLSGSNKRRDGGWLRISDTSVNEVDIRTVLEDGRAVFMLFYEKVKIEVEEPRAAVHPQPLIKPSPSPAPTPPPNPVKTSDMLSSLSYSSTSSGFMFQRPTSIPMDTHTSTTPTPYTDSNTLIKEESQSDKLRITPPVARVWRSSSVPPGFVPPPDYLLSDDISEAELSPRQSSSVGTKDDWLEVTDKDVNDDKNTVVLVESAGAEGPGQQPVDETNSNAANGDAPMEEHEAAQSGSTPLSTNKSKAKNRKKKKTPAVTDSQKEQETS